MINEAEDSSIAEIEPNARQRFDTDFDKAWKNLVDAHGNKLPANVQLTRAINNLLEKLHKHDQMHKLYKQE
jgi:hypothetical protein